MKTWNIYYASREYARVHNDPVLGRVQANTKDEAEMIAKQRGMGADGGVWAWPMGAVEYPTRVKDSYPLEDGQPDR